MKTIPLLLFLTYAFTAPLSVFCATDATNTLVVASWNVENLFDTVDDPANDGDDGYTPRGWARWTEERYTLKLRHLAQVIVFMKPDILCLTEVENRKVLEDLSATLLKEHHYALPVIVHREGGDARGIDVAILAVQAPIATNWFCAVPQQRDVLACDFDFSGRRLTLLLNHWKSQLGKKEECIAIRRQEAQSVRAFIQSRLNENPQAAILVAGDFNDQVHSSILTQEAGFVLDEAVVRSRPDGHLLWNLSGSLPENRRGTYYYAAGKQWNSFDSMSVTRGMLPGILPAAPWQIQTNAYRIVKFADHVNKANGGPLPFRRIRNKEKGGYFSAGFSDHFPVRVEVSPAASSATPTAPLE